MSTSPSGLARAARGSFAIIAATAILITPFAPAFAQADASSTQSTVSTTTDSGTSNTDTIAPVITLNGDATVNLTVGDTYTELGATATDNVDGTDAVTIGGDTVNTATAGTYTVTYDAVDAAGNHATQLKRTVIVQAAPDNSASTTPPVLTVSTTTDSDASTTDTTDGGSSSLFTPNSFFKSFALVTPTSLADGSILDYVIWGNSSVSFESGASIDSSGLTGSTGSVSADANETVGGVQAGSIHFGDNFLSKDNLVSNNNVSLGANSRVKGAVDAGGTISLGANSHVTGTQTQNATTPANPMPTLPTVAACTGASGSQSISHDTTLTPGTYGNVSVNANTTLTLSGSGSYVFSGLSIGGNGKLLVNLKNSGSNAYVCVQHSSSFDANANLSVSNGDASQVLMVVQGGTASFDGGDDLKGTVYATHGDITLGSNVSDNGALYASGSINFDANDSVSFDPSTQFANLVNPPVTDTAPVAADQSVTTAEGTALALTLGATDADNDTLTFATSSSPSHGTLSGTLQSDGTGLTYSPNAGYSGPDSFTFIANDGTENSNTATVSITVTAVAPVPSVITDAATNPSVSDATLNGTIGPVDANDGVSFWVSTSTIATTSPTIPVGVYSTPVLSAVTAGNNFSASLASLTTNAVVNGQVAGTMPAVTPNTTYNYVAWGDIDGTWYPGVVQSFTTAAVTPPADTTAPSVPTDLHFTNPALECGGITNSPTITANWDASTDDTGVTGYTYSVTTPGTHNASNPFTTTTTTNSRDGQFNEGQGVYTFQVNAFDAAGNISDYSTPCSVTYDATAPVVSVTPLPTDGVLSGKVTFTITINDANPATTTNKSIWTYLYNNLPPQASQGAKVDLSSGTVTFTVDTTKLANGTSTLDVGRLEDAAGNWSGAGDSYFKNYVIDNVPPDVTPPSVPTLISPLNGSFLDTNDFYFTWATSTDDSGGPVTYDAQFSQDPTETGGVLQNGIWDSITNGGDTLTSPTIHSTGAGDGTWYWQVRAKDAAGNWSGWSNIWNVTLDTQAPAKPVITSPADNSTLTTAQLQDVTWTDVSDAGTPIEYIYQSSLSAATSTDGSFSNPAYTSPLMATTTQATPNTPDGTYYVHVEAVDAAGNSTWSDPITVTVDNTVSPPPTNTSETVTVNEASLSPSFADAATTGNWFFADDQNNVLDNTLGSFIDGPSTAPLNDGSAQISTTGPTQGIALGTFSLAGTKLADISSLGYSTYRSAGDPALALALQFDINTDGTTSPAHYEGRLVYEPYYTHTVSDNTWQTWNPQDNATQAGTGIGNWWFSHANNGSAGQVVTTCSQATPCTWAQVLAQFPNIGISGGTYFKAGSNWNGDFTGNVDDFVVAVANGFNTDTKTFDFEPTDDSTPPQTNVKPTFQALFSAGSSGQFAPSGNSGQVLGASTFNFTRDLFLGMSGDDVTALQQFLIQNGYSIPAGATGYFGLQTQAALAKFQADNGITPAVGYFGPITRALVNEGTIEKTPVDSGTTDSIKSEIANLLAQLAALQAKVASSTASTTNQ